MTLADSAKSIVISAKSIVASAKSIVDYAKNFTLNKMTGYEKLIECSRPGNFKFQ